LQNIGEFSLGLTLGFDFLHSAHTQAEFDLDADVAFRTYESNGKYGLSSTWTETGASSSTETVFTTGPTDSGFKGLGDSFVYLFNPNSKPTGVTDSRWSVNPSFAYRNDFSEQFTLGFKATIPLGYNLLVLSQTGDMGGTSYQYNSVIKNTSIAPDVAVGASFNLYPDHFAMHAGLGIRLFSYSETIIETSTDDPALSPSGDPVNETTTLIGVPTVRLAVGLTVNFTQTMALDLLAVAANVTSIDGTKFTMLFSFKK
jgi:hypothetical protein